jgi:hypothetical protein
MGKISNGGDFCKTGGRLHSSIEISHANKQNTPNPTLTHRKE